MQLDFVNLVDKDFTYLEKIFQYFADKIKNIEDLQGNFMLEVNIVDNETIKTINRDYRNKDAVTDVISFAFNDEVDGEVKISGLDFNFLGEIYINFERAIIQANEIGQSFNREMCFLFVHGLLHLLGYDHMVIEDEKIMFELQDKIFKGENIE